ncbi:hypothetical protein [Jiella avicenniae]|uniref:Uncharacterized protein n=1 Tax=Jiella avicenniae TaxID=2907202 RepID=A0A9X1TAQ2_9HYPH|nr:hypothetical protein [Jiella avicenniae]MCE7027388.1 hypothetical protein [Jiella avicenniae]
MQKPWSKLKIVIVAAGCASILGGCVASDGTATRNRASLADRDTPSGGIVPGQLPD